MDVSITVDAPAPNLERLARLYRCQGREVLRETLRVYSRARLAGYLYAIRSTWWDDHALPAPALRELLCEYVVDFSQELEVYDREGRETGRA